MAQQKIALLVGISKYPSQSGWNELHAYNDLKCIKKTLIHQGFLEKNILVLSDQSATKEKILNAIASHLTKKVKSGDVAYFHFSGHGQQVCDDNSDEIDGYDEALVPFDSPLHFKSGKYEGEKLIRDDELGLAFDNLRHRLGENGHLMVVLDACHSGSATRGLAKGRGTDVVMASKQYVEEHTNKKAESDFISIDKDPGNNKLASMVVFSGTRSGEINNEMIGPEGQFLGPLSFALSKALANVKRTTTYRALFDQVKIIMNTETPGQHPQAEGILDQEILGGKIIGKTNHYALTKKGWLKSQKVRINAGQFNGLFPGTIVEFHPLDTRNPKNQKPLSTGEIIKADLTESIVSLNTPLQKNQAYNSWIFVNKYTFGDLEVNVKIDLHDEELKNSIIASSSDFSLIKFVKEKHDLVIENIGNEIQLHTVDGFILYRKRASFSQSILSEYLTKQILAYARTQFLQRLDINEPSLELKLEMVKLDTRNVTGNRTLDLSTSNQELKFKIGEEFKFRITNLGRSSAYFNLLEIEPNKTINPIFPDEEYSPEELYLKPGGQWETKETYFVGKDSPLGTGVFKLIAAEDPLDLRNIESSRGQSIKESDHPFAKLYAATFFYENRGTGGGSIKFSPTVEVKSFVYEFVK